MNFYQTRRNTASLALSNFSYKFAAVALATFLFWLCGCGGGTNRFAASVPASNFGVPPAAPPAAPPPPSSGSGNSSAGPPPLISATKIEGRPGWLWCTQKLNGSLCAAGRGNAISWLAQNQTKPSTDGSSAQFFIGGNTPYSNALWWNSLGPSSKPSRFTYDLWFYVDNASVTQALEFDVNQSFGGTRWVFGTECNVKGTGHWDVWDSKKNAWIPSSAPCHPFQPKTWNHLLWNFERSGDQVHYINVNLNGTLMSVNMYQAAQKNYAGEDVNVAFQMDGDFRQHPYSVWLDQVTLKGW